MLSTKILAGVTVVALAPAAAQAAKPPKPAPTPGATLTLVATPTPVVFTKPVALTGKLSTKPASAVTVKLESDDTRPYGDSYKPTGLTTTTTSSGDYKFSVKPQKNTQYRAVAQASPPVTSPAKLVLVRPLVGLRVSTQSPVAGRRVKFSGIVLPARNGATVSVQRRTSSGTFLTVKRATLVATSTGSAYSVRVRISRPGAYRVKLPGTLELVNGFSRTVGLTTR